GGPGILCADTCEAGGLVLPEFSPDVKSRLAAFLPAAASLANPVDLIASATPEHYCKTVEAVLASGEVDALIVIYIPVGLVEADAVAAAVSEGVVRARAAGAAGTPVLACWMADASTPAHLKLDAEHIPAFAFPEAPALVLGKVAAYAEWRCQPPGVIPD